MINTHQALALLGGSPVRNRPFPKHQTMFDEAERQMVLALLDDGELSGFSGRAGARFLGGEYVRRLEQDVCRIFGVRHAVSFNSATSALHGTIAAAGIGPGDEVITSPYSMSASASCVLMNNAVPVFADIDPATYCLDPLSVERRITPRTKAILTVNLFGHPSALPRLKRLAADRGLKLIEDNAQAAGATCEGRLAGTWGDMGVLSLNYHKAIQCGEGGLVITNDDELALRCQLIRNHGEAVAPDIERGDMENQLGWNYRLTELAAAVAIPQFGKLDRLVSIRRELSAELTGKLARFECLKLPTPAAGCTHTYYLYALQFDRKAAGISRGTFTAALKAEGIPVTEGYVKPIYLLPMYQKRLAYTKGCPFTCGHYDGVPDYTKGLCPVVEKMFEERLLITDVCKYPNTSSDVADVVAAIEKILEGTASLRTAGYQ